MYTYNSIWWVVLDFEIVIWYDLGVGNSIYKYNKLLLTC